MLEVVRLFDYWREHPPMHILLAGYLGSKSPGHQASSCKPEDLSQLTRLLGPANKPPPEVNRLVQWAEQMKDRMRPA
jgi:hypothetical protein